MGTFLFSPDTLWAQAKIKVACVGNSITEALALPKAKRTRISCRPCSGIIEVRNFGISGRTLLKKGDYRIGMKRGTPKALEWQRYGDH
jgi:hypothetical protein